MRTARLAWLSAATALLLTAATPAVALADEAADQTGGQTVVSGMIASVIDAAALGNAQPADQVGDDSQLGDQPGDFNDDSDEIVPPDSPGPEGLVPPDTQQPPQVVPPVVPPTGTETETAKPPTTKKPPATHKTPRHRHELPYTGGNATGFMLGGAMLALTGGALLVRRPKNWN